MSCKQFDNNYFILSKNHQDYANPTEQWHYQTIPPMLSMTMPVCEISKLLVDHPNDKINIAKKTSSATHLRTFNRQRHPFQSREYSTFIHNLKNIFGLSTATPPPLQEKSSTVARETETDFSLTKKVASTIIPDVTELPETLKHSTMAHHNFPRQTIVCRPMIRDRMINQQIENDIKQENVNGVIPNANVLYGSDKKKDDWDSFLHKTIKELMDKANKFKEDIEKSDWDKKLDEAGQIAKTNVKEIAKDVKVVTKVLSEEAIRNIKETDWRSKKLDMDKSAKEMVEAAQEEIKMLKAKIEEEKKKATDTDWNKILDGADKIAKQNIKDMSDQLNKYNQEIKNVDWGKKMEEAGDVAKKNAEDLAVTTKVATKVVKEEVQKNIKETNWQAKKDELEKSANDLLEKLKAAQDEMKKLKEKIEEEKKKEIGSSKKFAVIDKSFCKIAQDEQIVVTRDMDEWNNISVRFLKGMRFAEERAGTVEVRVNQAKPMTYHVGTDNLLTHFIKLQESKVRSARVYSIE